MPLLARDPDLRRSVVEVNGNIGLLRFNQLFPPFDNPAIRRALLLALNQADFMQAIAGEDRSAWRGDVGFFAPASPMASATGLSAHHRPARREPARRPRSRRPATRASRSS